MSVLRRDWYNVTRSDLFHIYPVGDIHLGNAACDEKRLQLVVNEIAADEHAYWIGLGDYCDFINCSDPRFEAASLASWFTVSDLTDLARAQLERFRDIITPIAPKCLGLIEGNHESAISRHTERNIYSDIVTMIKSAGQHPADFPLALGPYGWLTLAFHGGPTSAGGSWITQLNVHHGFTGGRLAGGKALSMQRWLWTHNADLVLFGHSHNTSTQVEAVEAIDRAGHVTVTNRLGVYCGTFLNQALYAQRAGFMPQSASNVVITLRPGAVDSRDRVRVTAVY